MRNWRHDFIYIRSRCFDLSVPKRILYELSCVFRLQFFFRNNYIKIIIALFHNKFMPLIHNIVHIIDSCNKGFNKLFLAAQLRAGINRFIDGYQHFLIFTVGIMILLYKHQNIINVDFYLPDQFNFKHHIICNIRTFPTFPFPLVTQILITSKVVLQIALRNQLIPLKFVKGKQKVSHTKNSTKQSNKILLVLLSDNLRF